MLDWWASALDRDARPRSEIERQADLSADPRRGWQASWRDPASAAAVVLAVAAAARGQGDLQAAWDAAQAGWVRAPLAADRGAALRADLDRLVLRAHRSRARPRARRSRRTALRSEWERFKERWAK